MRAVSTGGVAYFGPVKPQTLGRPFRPHSWSPGQFPQLTVPPQPSAMNPQLAPIDSQVRGVHAETHAPLLQERDPVHVPQSGVSPPQPFAT